MDDEAPKMYVKAETPVTATPASGPFVAVTFADVLRAFLVGALVGVVTTGVFYLLNKYVFGAALCRPGIQGCDNAPLYSTIVTTIVGLIVGIVSLAKAGIYRPLPAAVAAAVAMWGMYGLMANIAWYWGLLISFVLFGLAYALFTWLSRARSFVLSIILLIVAAVVVRLIAA